MPAGAGSEIHGLFGAYSQGSSRTRNPGLDDAIPLGLVQEWPVGRMLPRFGALVLLTAVALFLSASAASAQLELLPEPELPCVFGGGARTLRVVLRNPTAQPLEVALSNRVFQTTSATLAPAGELQPWKKLRVLPGQTVIESVVVAFPGVRVLSLFHIVWHDEKGRALRPSEVMVYPTNLLAEIAPLSPGRPLGLLDPQNQLKPLLLAAKLDFVDLERDGLEHFDGALAILGPFATSGQMPRGLAATVRKRAQAGLGIVWIQSSTRVRRPEPTTYAVPVGSGVVVVAAASATRDLADNPIAQLNLLRFARLAVKREPLDLPDPTP